MVSLPDGRVMTGLSVGDPHGVPLLLMHGTPSSRQVARLGASEAAAAGVRVIAPNRPGYGGSTPAPPSLRGVAVDMQVVANRFGLEQYAVLGISGGGAYAIATAIVDEARVTRLGVGVGVAPSWRDLDPPSEGDAEDRAILALVDEGDVDTALSAFREKGDREFTTLLALDDEALMTYFVTHVPQRELAWFRPARTDWLLDR